MSELIQELRITQTGGQIFFAFLFGVAFTPVFERADENSNSYYDWMISNAFAIYLMQGVVASMMENFVKFPPRQKPGSFNLDRVMEAVTRGAGAK